MTAALGIGSIKLEGFSVDPELRREKLIIVFRGSGDIEAMAPLRAYLMNVHSEAQLSKRTEVVVDLHELYFMNSSCIKTFMMWIGQVGNAPGGGYQIRFLTDRNLRWQRRTLESMRRMAPETLVVESYDTAAF